MALAEAGAGGDLVIADTREQVANLNAEIRDHRAAGRAEHGRTVATARGERIGPGDRVATRHNDPDLQVANRQTWTVTSIGVDGSLRLHDPHRYGRDPEIPVDYATQFVELAYATTVHGAQGETVESAHVRIGEHTGAASAYVAMTRGRDVNTAHLVADTLQDAKRQWIDVFGRDRADLGPAHARRQALDGIDRYGPHVRRRPAPSRPPAPSMQSRGPSL
ncbi:hypothetical protein [Nocardioides sp.]|uniref:hypothetical protein n=1 Tax=Nocardioides sp. TaxID=35761 RepID=UPI002F3FC4F1